jgi:hypothetical protein
VRHYVGSLGLLYYIEPKLVGKKSPPEDFAKASALLSGPAPFISQVEKVFEEMDSQRVYLAKCEPSESRIAEAALIGEWETRNKRRERTPPSVVGPVSIVHLPVKPGEE